MIFDVYAIGVCLYHYDFRSFKKPGDLTLGQEGHRRKNSCFKRALFFFSDVGNVCRRREL